MKLEDFWTFIHRSAAETASQDQRTEGLTTQLAQLPISEIIEFELHLTDQRKRLDTRLMGGALPGTSCRAGAQTTASGTSNPG
ncbi:DUF4240 domain-containing protein [Nonomuraea sp. NPDC003707]